MYISYIASESYWSYHHCILPVKSADPSSAQQCRAASPLRPTIKALCGVFAGPQGCEGFVPGSLWKQSYSYSSRLCALQRVAWQGPCWLLLGELVVTQRSEWEQGLAKAAAPVST